MTTRNRAIPLLASVAALALAITACGDTTPQSSEPDDKAPIVSVPEQFDTSSPSWDPIIDLPAGDTTRSAISEPGTHYAYAYRTEQGISVGQINLESGQRTEEHTVEALEVVPGDSAVGNVGLMYSGNRLVLLQAGTAVDGSSNQWTAAIFEVGKHVEPTVVTEDISANATVTLPSANTGTGPIISVAEQAVDRQFALNTELAEVIEVSSEDTESFTGCGDEENCVLPVRAVAQDRGTTVETFRETSEPSRPVCSDDLTRTSADEHGFNGCMSGFRTAEWSSQDADVAPEQANPNSAYLYAAGNGYLIGAWRGQDGGVVYRTINTADPRAAHAELTCDETITGTSLHDLHVSPSGQYLAAGSLLFDIQNGQGHCFDHGDSGPTFVSVNDAGVAWGARDSAWQPSRYVKEPVSGTLDGELVPAGEGVAVPVSFIRGAEAEYGVFAVAEDAQQDSTVLTALPR